MSVIQLRQAGKLGLLFAGLVAVTAGFASWWFTAPLESPGSSESPPTTASETAAHSQATAVKPNGAQCQIEEIETASNPWPTSRLDGNAAKRVALDLLLAAERFLEKVPGCTMTMVKQERIKGKLLPEQTYFMKIRHAPFAIYMKAIQPAAGRELIYATGHYDDMVIAHPVGLSRLLVPRVKIPPDHPFILGESRHPFNQAGPLNMIRKMIAARRLDLKDPGATTVLEPATGEDGRQWLKATHTYPAPSVERPFSETEVFFDPDHHLPLRFIGYDWSENGRAEHLLGERYTYDDLRLDVPLTNTDFDPANPSYEFHRL